MTPAVITLSCLLFKQLANMLDWSNGLSSFLNRFRCYVCLHGAYNLFEPSIKMLHEQVTRDILPRQTLCVNASTPEQLCLLALQ